MYKMESIKIQKSAKKDLDRLKLVPCETYNSVIERLIKEHKPKKKGAKMTRRL